MEALLMSSNCQVSLPRIRSSSSSSNNNRNNSIKISTYKGHRNSSILSKSLTWSTNNFYTRKNYMGPMLASQGNDAQSSADNNAGPPPGKPWINWMVGVILSLVMPFVTGRWKTLLAIKDEVCRVLNIVETVAQTVEKVADEVAQVTDEVADSLPEGGTMQNIVCNISNVAEDTAQHAQFVDQFIDKVEDVENEIVSSFADGEHKTAIQEDKVDVDEVAKDDNIQSDQQELGQKHEIAVEEVAQTKIMDQPK